MTQIEKIEAEIEKLRKQVDRLKGGEWKEGQWLINEEGTRLVRFKEYEDEHAFTSSEKYGDVDHLDHCSWAVQCFRPATEEEIKDALVAEAKKRGLWNTPIRGVDRGDVGRRPHYNPGVYNKETNRLWSAYEVVYYDGEWAEPLEDIITIGETALTIEDEEIKLSYGDTISKERFKHFYSLVQKYDLSVSRGGECIDGQIQELADKIGVGEHRFTISGNLTLNTTCWEI